MGILNISNNEDILDQLGRTKRRIIIELYRHKVGYKKLAKILGIGVETVRSHIKRGKYSRSLLELGCIKRTEQGWVLTPKGLEIAEILKEDPTLKAFFY
ncbi:MAG: sigma factor-like helix-turn-helix DNA-binding protein [Candidatus Hermodarchaeota archaeon]